MLMTSPGPRSPESQLVADIPSALHGQMSQVSSIPQPLCPRPLLEAVIFVFNGSN